MVLNSQRKLKAARRECLPKWQAGAKKAYRLVKASSSSQLIVEQNLTIHKTAIIMNKTASPCLELPCTNRLLPPFFGLAYYHSRLDN
jgi:hypothetical protein